MVGSATARRLALPRLDWNVCEAGFRLAIQADHFRSAVVHHPTASHLAGLHRHLRQHCQIADGWSASDALLHVRQHPVELLLHLPNQHFHYVYCQCPPIWQSLLPTPGHADFYSYLEFDHLRDPVCVLFGLPALFLFAWISRRVDHLGVRTAIAVGADGWAGARFWHHHLVHDHQVSRSAIPGQFWGWLVDVRHAGHLPCLEHPREMALGGERQPRHADH